MRTCLYPILFFVLLIFVPQAAKAQNASIKGVIKTTDGQPVQYAHVKVEGTSKGTASDKNGNYEIKSLKPGYYTLRVSITGLESKSQQVELAEGETRIIDFVLSESSRELEEIVVTSNAYRYNTDMPSPTLRINTPLLEAPQNIQIVTSELLKDQQIFDMLESVTRNISGAQRLEHWDNYARINMRGTQLTSFRNGMNVQLSPWSPLTEDMSMVDRIEFVKGPAGFMLANGQPGGFYNVVTKKPTGYEKGEFSFSLGSFETYRSTLDLDGKLTKSGKLLYRLNVMGQLRGSHRDFEYNNRYSVAPVLKYQINNNSSFTLEYNEQYSQMNVIGSNYAFSATGYGELPVNFTTAEPNLSPSNMFDRCVLAVFEHQLSPDWKFTAQTSYLYYHQTGQSLWPRSVSSEGYMQRGISVWDALGFNKNGQFFVNGLVQLGKITHNILAGLDMSHRDYYADWNQAALLGDTTFNIYNPQYGRVAPENIPQWDRSKDIIERGVRYNNSYTGVYLQDEIRLFENKLRLTAGGRFTSNTYINPYSGSANDSKITPRAGISWTITTATTTYALYDQIFLGNPGTNWQGNNFKPISGHSLEWGIKRDWAQGKWSSSFSIYEITRNNVLTTDLEHPDPQTGQFIFQTETGQQKNKGIELDLRGEIVSGLQIIVNYAYTDARITKDSNPELVGSKVAGATEQIQNIWLSYSCAGTRLRGLKFSAGYQYQHGRSSWFVSNNSQQALPDYFRLDGGIGYVANNFSINFLVNNVLNRYLYSGAYYYGTYYWQTEPGRNFRLTVSFRF